MSRANMVILVASLVLFLSLICTSSTGGEATPYGVHVVTYADERSKMALAVPGDGYYAFENWEVSIYARTNSSYSIAYLNGEQITSGDFDRYVLVEFTLREGLNHLVISVDGLDFEYRNILVKPTGFYRIVNEGQAPSHWDTEYMLTEMELFVRDLKVSVSSLLLAGIAFYWVMRKYGGDNEREASDVL